MVDIKDADIVADLSTADGRNAAIEGIRAAAPDGLDGFIPCAGLGPQVSPPSLVSRVNFFGTTVLTEGVLDLLEKRGGGIVLISSNSAPMGYDKGFTDLLLAQDEAAAAAKADELGDGQVAYGGSKFAVTCWMRDKAAGLASRGIRINAIAPGFTRTPLTDAGMQSKDFGNVMKDFVDSIPVGRPGEPEDMANAVSFLFSDKASFIVGSILFVDGGHDAMFRPNNF